MSKNRNLPNNVVQLQFQNWIDPRFWRANNNAHPEDHLILIDGKYYDPDTTIEELDMVVSNTESNTLSDPGEVNAPVTPRRKSIKRRKTTKKRKNNRFGFSKAFRSLGKGLKKLTGATRRRRA